MFTSNHYREQLKIFGCSLFFPACPFGGIIIQKVANVAI